MKIVCEACQAKYSIADDKVRGKVFKIRCKKCSHVIVVRGAGEAASGPSGEFASSPSSSPDLTLDAGWHIVVDGEQVGPLSEADIKGRLARGEISAETYIWKEGLADWVKISSLPDFGQEGDGAGPFAGGEPGGLFGNAPTAVTSAPADVFGQAGGMGASAHGGRAGGDLFAAPTSPAVDNGATAIGGGYGGGFEASLPAAAGGAQGGGGLTAQRHENSVLFSLANLEALAKPASAPLPATRAQAPSTTTTTEGSGLIDIRAMANMTLGGQSNRNNDKAMDLPAFSAPQFSPVAPVLLAPASSMPKWFIPVMLGFGVALVALVFVSMKLFTSRNEVAAVPPPVVAPPVPAAAPGAKAPAAPAGAPATATAPAAGAPPATPPPPAEALPPREPAAPKAVAEKAAPRPRSQGGRPPRGGGSSRNLDDQLAGRLAGVGATPPKPPPAEAAPKKPKDDIEALLEAASGGGRRSAAAPRREEEEPAARPSEKLPPLGIQEINKGMQQVLPKARECYGQFKVPGVANSKITVNQSGRVTSVTVSGKFAGTPSGNCVETAIKGARFAPSAGLTFDYPVPLR